MPPFLDPSPPPTGQPIIPQGKGSMLPPEMVPGYTDTPDTSKKDDIKNPEAYKYYVPMRLADGEDARVIQYIEDDISEIKKQYDECQYFEKLEAMRKEMDYVKSEEDDGGGIEQKKVVLIATYAEIIAGRGRRQTMGSRPVFQLMYEPNDIKEEPETQDINALRDREDRLDHAIRSKIKYEELIEQAYRLSGMGSSIVKIPFVHEVSLPYKRMIKVSGSDAGAIKAYEDENARELAAGKGKKYQSWLDLKNGKDVWIEKDESEVTYHGARPYIVEPENFYARPKIKDFADQPGIHERFVWKWSDIEARERSGYYDEGTIEKLREYYGREKKDVQVENIDYTVWESTIIYRTESDKRSYRYKVTFDETSRIVLKAIYYPYRICRPDYESYSMFPKHNSWIGYTMEEKLSDILAMLNSLVNSVFNELGIAHNQVLMTDDQDFIRDASRKVIPILDGQVTVVPFQKGSNFRQMTFDYQPADRMPMLSWCMNMAEIISGVSATLASGQETPQDTNAPYAKTALKYSVTNMRIEDIIINLQKTDAKVAEQIDMIENQFGTQSQSEKEAVSRENISHKIIYVCQGSAMSFDKMTDNKIVLAMIEFIKANYPEIWNDLDSKYAIFQVVLNNTQGSIERIKDILYKPLKAVLASREEMLKLIEFMQSKGMSMTQIMAQIGGIQGGQPGAGAGTPPGLPTGAPGASGGPQLPPRPGMANPPGMPQG